MHFPRFMRQVNRVFTNQVFGTFAGFVLPFAIVHHVGRRSGCRYRTPVVAFGSSAGLVIPMTYGRDVDWARNMVRANGAEVERGGRRMVVRNPRIVGFEEAAARLPAAALPVFWAAGLPGYVLADL